jgi:hypothetical protein
MVNKLYHRHENSNNLSAFKSILLIIFTCFQLLSYGQLMIDNVMELIQQRKVRKYIEGAEEVASIQ